MKNKIEILEERIFALNNTLGDIDTNEFNHKAGAKSIIVKDKLKTVSDVIIHLQKEISENDSITFKDIYRKCKLGGDLFFNNSLKINKEIFLFI